MSLDRNKTWDLDAQKPRPLGKSPRGTPEKTRHLPFENAQSAVSADNHLTDHGSFCIHPRSPMTAFLKTVALAALVAFEGVAGAASSEIINDSPFLPAGMEMGPTRPAEGQSFELRGIMQDFDGPQYCIYDPAMKACVWVHLNEDGHPFVVTSADADREAVSLRLRDGRLFTLILRASRVATLAKTPSAPSEAAALAPPPPAPELDTTGLTPAQVGALRRLPPQKAEAMRQYFLRHSGPQSAPPQDTP
jgi:hypothetical protein